jgi:hypothetical protein
MQTQPQFVNQQTIAPGYAAPIAQYQPQPIEPTSVHQPVMFRPQQSSSVLPAIGLAAGVILAIWGMGKGSEASDLKSQLQLAQLTQQQQQQKISQLEQTVATQQAQMQGMVTMGAIVAH